MGKWRVFDEYHLQVLVVENCVLQQSMLIRLELSFFRFAKGLVMAAIEVVVDGSTSNKGLDYFTCCWFSSTIPSILVIALVVLILGGRLINQTLLAVAHIRVDTIVWRIPQEHIIIICVVKFCCLKVVVVGVCVAFDSLYCVWGRHCNS